MAAKLPPCDGAALSADGRSAYVFPPRNTVMVFFTLLFSGFQVSHPRGGLYRGTSRLNFTDVLFAIFEWA